eukprot:2439598-Alexandrium_andersonii.AAC.1
MSPGAGALYQQQMRSEPRSVCARMQRRSAVSDVSTCANMPQQESRAKTATPPHPLVPLSRSRRARQV